MKDILVALAVVAGFTATLFIGYQFSWYMFSIAPQENRDRVVNTVTAVCNYSMNINNYDACHVAEDASSTEFTCKLNSCQVKDN